MYLVFLKYDYFTFSFYIPVWAWTLWLKPVIPVLWKLEVDIHYEFKPSLYYLISSKPAWAAE